MSATAERIYVIEGMTCGHCELSVREEVEGLTGVESVRADRVTGRLIVRGDVDAVAVHQAVRAAGYRVAS